MTGAAGYSEHDEDLIGFTVPTEAYLSITLDWDTTDDIDYYVLGPKMAIRLLIMRTIATTMRNPSLA